jgi:aspartate/methionine/tyrosine aminotransferase
VSAWEAHERNGWALDPADLKHTIRRNTRAVVLNTPHNPTGFLMTLEGFSEVNRIVQENGIILFSDEVYRECEYVAADRLPAACDINNHAVSLGGMSKSYGLPGLRIGWIATHNADLYARIAGLKDYTTLCNSAPGEVLAEIALRHREKVLKRNMEVITGNLTVLDEFFARHNEQFRWVRPRAGPIAFPRLVGADVESFCHQLVTTASVLLLPGTIFDDRENHFRIGFGRQNMAEAVARLEQFLHSGHK